MAGETLSQVFEEMRSLFKSIDTRTTAVSVKGQSWCNYFTVARLSHLRPDGIKKIQSQIVRGHGKVKSASLRVLMDALSIDQFSHFIASINKSLLVEDTQVDFVPLVGNPLDTYCEFKDLHNAYDNWAFLECKPQEVEIKTGEPTYEVASARDALFVSNQNAALRCNFDSPQTALRYYLGLGQEWPGMQLRNRVQIRIPIFGKIERIELRNRSLIAKARWHKAMTAFQVNYRRMGRGKPLGLGYAGPAVLPSPYYEQAELKALPIPLKATKKGRRARQFVSRDLVLETNLDLNDHSVLIDSRVDVDLVYLGLNGLRIQSAITTLSQVLASSWPELSNLLLGGVSLFSSREDFEKELLAPHGMKINTSGLKLEPQHVFERAVTDLLTFAGFRAIWLGEKDVLRSNEGTKYQLGAADILALNTMTKSFLVVQCSTSVPSSTDIIAISNTADRIRSMLSVHFPLDPDSIRAAIFFADKGGQDQSSAAVEHKVAIFDSTAIKELLLKLEKGTLDLRRDFGPAMSRIM